MTFEEIIDQAVAMLQRRGRVTYRALKVQFQLDDDLLDTLKEEILYSQPLVIDDEGKGLIWTGESETKSEPVSARPDQPVVKPEAQSIQVEPLPPAPPIPDAERRQLTVMFCDLADSTKLSGQLDPEDLRDVIRAYQSTSAEVIERYDGYIAQHLGDGLMVYFGWPQAHEDDALRAVHAGLGILNAMGGLNERLEREKGICLAVRIGIHTGIVVVGEMGQGASQEHLALGETPNIASRIEGVAEPDTVAVSDVTYQLVQGYFVCNDLGLHTMKGVDEPQHVYRVLKESDAQSRFDVAAAKGLTPLVGRESESALLFDRWQQVKDGQGQVMLLSGEAGIGKSRLLQVMKEHVADEAHTLLECRSSPYYQNTAFYPITDMLQPILNCSQDDTPEAKLNTLEQTLSQYTFELIEAVPLFANLLSLSIPEDRYQPLNMSPQRQRQLTLETVVAMLLQRAEHQPVLFILEDLHWTDPSTLELLDLLIDQTPTAAICVLLTCRPTFQPSWGSRSYLTPIALSRLSGSQIESMSERVAGGKRLPAEVVQQIVEKTDGVPLFVEEMTKAVMELGALKEVNGQYELANYFSTLTIPATLQDSLMARLDRLVTAKAVAQYAAVIGRQFSYELLQAVSQLDDTTLQRELRRLVEAELLYQRGLQSQAIYIFKHALVQDIAYQSLLRSTRQQYHRRTAQVLEERFPETSETQPELLAHHYTEAGLPEQAVLSWQRAGEQAIQRSANTEAIIYLQKGLEVLTALPDTDERVQHELVLQLALSVSLMESKGNGDPDVGRVLGRARELCHRMEDGPQSFTILQGLVKYHVAAGEGQLAVELGEELLSLAQRFQDPSSLLRAHLVHGVTLYFGGQFTASLAHMKHGLDLYNPQQHRLVARYGTNPGTQLLCWTAHNLWFLGYADQAVQRGQETLVRTEEFAHPYNLAHSLLLIAILHQLRGEIHTVFNLADASMTLATEHGFQERLALGLVCRGWALAAHGQSEEGIAEIHRGLALGSIGKRGQSRPYQLGLLAEAYGKTWQVGEGLVVLDEALTLVDETGACAWEAELYGLKGEFLLSQSSDNAIQAETCFHQALGIARRQKAKSLELRAATSLARLWQSQGKRQAAYDLLAPVYEWFTEGFDTADLKDAKVLLEELS